MTNQQIKKTLPQKQATAQRNHSTEALKSEDQLTFIDHVYELRNRLFWLVAVLVATSAIGFQFKDVLVNFIIAPLHGEKLIYLTPGGGFSFIFTVCLYFGALLTIPFVVYHIYRFLQPILGQTSRRFLVGIVTLSGMLALTGAVFGYIVAIPGAINFLTTFAGDAVTPNLTAESYLGFVMAYLLGLAALFQLPLLLFIFDHVRPFPPGSLLSSQRFVIVGAVIAAAIITPTPDIVNQMIVAGPIIAVYQLGAIAIFLRRRLDNRQVKQVDTVMQSPEPSPLEAIAPLPVVARPEVLATPASAAHPVVANRPLSRSIDGFALKRSGMTIAPVRAASSLAMKPHRVVAASAVRRPAKVSRPLRSLDGFLLVNSIYAK
jgi:sec-independent protein translocase protein TatC